MPRILILTLLLAACGADGPPEPPPSASPSAAAPVSLKVSGEARIGVVWRP